MSEIKLGKNESLDDALRRFKKQCARTGVVSEARKREYYEKPSEIRKRSTTKLKETTKDINTYPFIRKLLTK